jgi:DNA-binding LacI/PurR family transcriptional regulator
MSGEQRPTLEHVARVAGVSRATVSRVVNGVGTVDPALREAVERAVERTGYLPNPAARALVTRRTGSVALVVSEAEQRGVPEPFVGRVFTDPFFGRIVTGVLRVLRPAGMQLMLFLADDAAAREQVTGYLRQGHVDGVILISAHAGDPLPAALTAAGLPVVLSGRPGRGVSVSHVDADQRAGGALAAERLVDRGCRHLATISGPLDMPAARQRLAGFRAALTRRGLPEPPSVAGTFTLDSGESAMSRLLADHPDLDGVFVGNDLMAQGALLVLRDRGVPVPDRIAVVGFDDSSAALACRPRLTTVRQPIEDMATEMAQLLLAHIQSPDRPPSARIFPPNLVTRDSA